jgi:hypothetical protein
MSCVGFSQHCGCDGCRIVHVLLNEEVGDRDCNCPDCRVARGLPPGLTAEEVEWQREWEEYRRRGPGNSYWPS